MTQDLNDIKKQRDRFLAFSFAASDLFIEVNEENAISFALGAAKGLTGITDKDLLGRKWLDLFSFADVGVLTSLRERSKAGQRIGPLLVNFSSKMGGKAAVFYGLKMPESRCFYFTLGLGNDLLNKLKTPHPSLETNLDTSPNKRIPKILNKEKFIITAQDLLIKARLASRNISMSLLDINASSEDIERIGLNNWTDIEYLISEILLSESADGRTAGKIGDGRYSFLHRDEVEAETITERITALLSERDPDGIGIEVQSQTLEGDLAAMTPKELARAIQYTVSEFEEKGAPLATKKLNDSFENYAATHVSKIEKLQKIITTGEFTELFQPVVQMKNGKLAYYEFLSKFPQGNTKDWMELAEDTGLAPNYDLAVIDRTLQFIQYKAGATNNKFFVNISSPAIQSSAFFTRLLDLLDRKEAYARRLSFEVTETYNVENIKKASTHIRTLRQRGHSVALDNFGSGTNAFEYLKNLGVDYVKIDGRYISNILTSHRDEEIVRNIAKMCLSLNIIPIAKHVETKEQVTALLEMGVTFGQGFLFSPATSKPEYVPPVGLLKK